MFSWLTGGGGVFGSSSQKEKDVLKLLEEVTSLTRSLAVLEQEWEERELRVLDLQEERIGERDAVQRAVDHTIELVKKSIGEKHAQTFREVAAKNVEQERRTAEAVCQKAEEPDNSSVHAGAERHEETVNDMREQFHSKCDAFDRAIAGDREQLEFMRKRQGDALKLLSASHASALGMLVTQHKGACSSKAAARQAAESTLRASFASELGELREKLSLEERLTVPVATQLTKANAELEEYTTSLRRFQARHRSTQLRHATEINELTFQTTEIQEEATRAHEKRLENIAAEQDEKLQAVQKELDVEMEKQRKILVDRLWL
eukprot:TRINITY_DN6063_c0_g1_i1.p1 TRINITY_DN6063_c0_g1~~TRINITY_DN6063_c0_g1_i1.p1  ORF type:complete len:319 (-),score=114.46 TRINITY_DN6063_c0_g1_i1:473-1429(-)